MSFTVTNLGSNRRETTYNLNRHTNIFWGLNGAGKTSLLKILHSALSNDARMLAKVPFDSASVEFFSEQHQVSYRRSITKNTILENSQVSDDPTRLMSDYEGYVGENTVPWITKRTSIPPKGYKPVNARRIPNRMAHGYLPISRVNDRRYIAHWHSQTARGVDEEYLDTMFSQQVSEKWQIYNSKALEQIQEIQQQGIGAILSILFGGVEKEMPRKSEKNLDIDSTYALVSNFLQDQNIYVDFDQKSFSMQLQEDRKLQRIIERIEAVSDQSMQALKPQREMKAVIERLYSGQKTVVLGPRGIEVRLGKDTRIPVEQLSSGERQLLHIMLETITSGNNAVIIDEPELSMHVDWQRVLVDSMRAVNSGCQVIIATHSPEVMALVDDNDIFEL